MLRLIKKILFPIRVLAARFVWLPNPDQPTIVYKAAHLLASQRLEGDYLEFGVYQGYSFIRAYQTLRYVFKRVATDAHSPERFALWEQMRYFAFDSFQGLPELHGIDSGSREFAPGHYACSEAHFRRNVAAAGLPPGKVITVPGWYDETCTPDTLQRLGLARAAIIHIDCDLYESARTVLRFVTPLLQEGTVLIFDDWYNFAGNPALGEQRAFAEWKAGLPGWAFTEYQKEGPVRNSFIANKVREG